MSQLSGDMSDIDFKDKHADKNIRTKNNKFKHTLMSDNSENENEDFLMTDRDISHQQACVKETKFSFVKIHRVGSGAWHNMLVRFAINNNLHVALPHCASDFDNYQIFPQVARKIYLNKFPAHMNVTQYSLFFDHSVFDREEQLKFMPANTVFFTQLRNPLSQARSVFQHFHGGLTAGTRQYKEPFYEYLAQEDKTDIRMRRGTRCFSPPAEFSLTRNFQAFSMGYMNAAENNITDFQRFLKMFDDVFGFITILEDLDTSLVLMKRKYCWDFNDILYIHTHKKVALKEQNDPEEELKIKREKEQLVGIHKQWSTLDYVLYDHFYAKLHAKVEIQKQDFFEELNEFKILIQNFTVFCANMCQDFSALKPTQIEAIRNKLFTSLPIVKSKFHDSFSITYLDCVLLMAKERINKVILKLRQYPEACLDLINARLVGLNKDDCDLEQHVYPGYHIKEFERFVLNTKECVANKY